MILGGIDTAIAMRFAMVLGAGIALWFLADMAGDAREARVYREINAAIAKTNSEIDAQLSVDDKIALVAQRARDKALSDAKAIPAVGPICPASEEQAAALSRIR